jgi:pSer/pThr/pTyr-binding forkhead associated (FHA) protein
MPMALIIVRGPGTGQTFTLGTDTVIIGRETQTAKFVIADPAISRRHARISRQDSAYTIEDLNSTNGTFINAERVVGTVALVPGDLIELGTAVTLSYEDLDAANVTMLALNQNKVAELLDDIVQQDYFQKLQKQAKQLRRKTDETDSKQSAP